MLKLFIIWDLRFGIWDLTLRQVQCDNFGYWDVDFGIFSNKAFSLL